MIVLTTTKAKAMKRKRERKKRKEEKKNTDHSPVNFYENGRPVFASEPWRIREATRALTHASPRWHFWECGCQKSPQKYEQRRRKEAAVSLFVGGWSSPLRGGVVVPRVTFQFPVDEPFETCDEREIYAWSINQPLFIKYSLKRRSKENRHTMTKMNLSFHVYWDNIR